MTVLDDTEKILVYGPICDHCLGRFFGKRSHGLTNAERGRCLRVVRALEQDLPCEGEPESCWICGGTFRSVGLWAERVVAALEGIEYATFLIGTRVPPIAAESEEMVWSDLSLSSPEPFKAEMNREVGKAVSRISGKSVDFARPDVVAILDLAEDRVEIQISPLFIYGRYLKFERGIPQTHWDCRICRGKGCERCGFSGKMYQDSVEELIGRPLIRAFEAADAVLHGSGREDIDARMLGSGRPFVMEIVSPRRRSLDLGDLEERVNREAEGRVGVSFQRWSNRSEVETLKSKQGYKKYRILVEVSGDVSLDEVNGALSRLEGAVIHQRTPQRVAHRRADKVRDRRVVHIDLVHSEDGRFLIDVVGEAGLYIKELVSGDNGRTHPSLAELLGCEAHVVDLDVVLVE
ncbi:MAG: tRNA pseudouridine(54/55) synthase Pus10 [Methanomicrobiales archaeon]|nr:tRNA pseudouridine(54/55) synthase Pus10 [Methanomicrobiales archaeon]MDI6875308.1 tRNA pseudouridine(54/55) synthase Pus10 [Methanomicrobiales archaeon]